jgi:ATP-binding cassette subfamily C (CFTR/MRP) protein 4
MAWGTQLLISTQVMRIGWNLRLGMTVALQKKLLRTRAAEVSRVSTGFIVSLVTNDCQRFDNLLPFLHAPWVSVILIVVAYFLISNIVGYAAAAAGLSVLLVSVAIQARLGFVFKKLRAKTAKATDGRVRLISELLNGILSVKAFAWEEPCLEAVAAARSKEASTVLRAQWCRSLTAALYFSTTAMSVFATYAVYFRTQRGQKLSVGDVTSLVALLNALRQIVSFGCAYFAMAGPECLVAVRRMQRFLELDECARVPECDEHLLKAKEVTVAWPHATPAVSNACCAVRPGQVIVVAGPVGCGKSSLLQASLGELDVTSGSLESIQNVVYAPQSLQCGNQISRRHRRDGVPVIASARWRGGRPTPSTRLLDGVEAHEGIS